MFTKSDIEKYFIAEKQESLFFLIFGIVAIVTSFAFFFILKPSFYKGAAIPLLLIGLLMSVIRFTVYKRSDNDRIRNVNAYDTNPSQFKKVELPRMKKVMRRIVLFRYMEIFLFFAGVGLYVYFIMDFKNDFWRGLGLALAVMAIIALVSDQYAEKRGKVYTKGIESLILKNN